MKHSIPVYIAIMAGVSFLIRVLPMTLIRRPIRSRFIRSFLYYVPYVTLAVMTFPAILDSAPSLLSGLLALAAGIGLAWSGAGLFPVAVTCSGIALLLQLIF